MHQACFYCCLHYFCLSHAIFSLVLFLCLSKTHTNEQTNKYTRDCLCIYIILIQSHGHNLVKVVNPRFFSSVAADIGGACSGSDACSDQTIMACDVTCSKSLFSVYFQR